MLVMDYSVIVTVMEVDYSGLVVFFGFLFHRTETLRGQGRRDG